MATGCLRHFAAVGIIAVSAIFCRLFGIHIDQVFDERILQTRSGLVSYLLILLALGYLSYRLAGWLIQQAHKEHQAKGRLVTATASESSASPPKAPE
jgi:hypothetical protein